MQHRLLVVSYVVSDGSLGTGRVETLHPDEVALDWLELFPDDIVMLVEDV